MALPGLGGGAPRRRVRLGPGGGGTRAARPGPGCGASRQPRGPAPMAEGTPEGAARGGAAEVLRRARPAHGGRATSGRGQQRQRTPRRRLSTAGRGLTACTAARLMIFFFIFRYQLNVESLLIESLVLYNFYYSFLSL